MGRVPVKINNIKLTLALFLTVMVGGIIAGLFFIEIPDGNREVAYTLLGAVSTALITVINSILRKPSE